MSMERYKQVIHEDFIKDADFMDRTIKNLGLDTNSRVLDVGTGLGAMSILLALNGFDVLTGQPEKDPEWDECKKAHNGHDAEHGHHHAFPMSDWKDNARAVGVKDKIKFQFLNAEHLDFPDGSFDGVFMYDTLQHIKNRERALNESLRVVDTGGLVCVIEWNEKSIAETEEEYGFTIDYIDPGEILEREDVSVDRIEGTFVNVFILRKL